MNYFGVLAGLATLLFIGLGFPLVIHAERLFGFTCWPYMLSVGIIMISLSAFTPASWLSIGLGVLGATFAWGSTELKEQARRAEIGWYPFNPHKIELPLYGYIKRLKAPHL